METVRKAWDFYNVKNGSSFVTSKSSSKNLSNENKHRTKEGVFAHKRMERTPGDQPPTDCMTSGPEQENVLVVYGKWTPLGAGERDVLEVPAKEQERTETAHPGEEVQEIKNP